MMRTCWCSVAGAVIGFLLAVVMVMIASGGQPGSDTAFIILLLGGLLAAGGAIAGAVIGGAADLLQYLKARDAIAARTGKESGSTALKQ